MQVINTIAIAILTIATAERMHAANGMTEKLTKYYITSKSGVSPDGPRMKSLTVQRPGILSVAPADAAFLDVCPSLFRAGEVRSSPGYFCSELAKKSEKSLRVGDRVYVSSVQVNTVADKVGFRLTTCDPCNVAAPINYRSSLVFEFPKGYLMQAEPEEAIRAIDAVLTDEPARSNVAKEVAPETHNEVPPKEELRRKSERVIDPQSPLKSGQTLEEVERIAGRPAMVAQLGTKTIYIYPNFKVIFLSGRLSDVQ